MNLHDLRARMRRLEELIRGLCLEESLWRKRPAPIMTLDRIAYMDAIHEAIHGLESARIILARVICGLEIAACSIHPWPGMMR
jgi:hypothetical protein